MPIDKVLQQAVITSSYIANIAGKVETAPSDDTVAQYTRYKVDGIKELIVTTAFPLVDQEEKPDDVIPATVGATKAAMAWEKGIALQYTCPSDDIVTATVRYCLVEDICWISNTNGGGNGVGAVEGAGVGKDDGSTVGRPGSGVGPGKG